LGTFISDFRISMARNKSVDTLCSVSTVTQVLSLGAVRFYLRVCAAALRHLKTGLQQRYGHAAFYWKRAFFCRAGSQLAT